MQFNTCIARMMEYTNAIAKYVTEKTINTTFLKETVDDFVRLLAPFAPHFSEEQWNLLGNTYSVFNESLPKFDPSALIKDEVEIAVQLNGKVKAKINIASSLTEDQIKETALNDEHVKTAIGDKTVVKVIVIKGRLVNIVVK